MERSAQKMQASRLTVKFTFWWGGALNIFKTWIFDFSDSVANAAVQADDTDVRCWTNDLTRGVNGADSCHVSHNKSSENLGILGLLYRWKNIKVTKIVRYQRLFFHQQRHDCRHQYFYIYIQSVSANCFKTFRSDKDDTETSILIWDTWGVNARETP